MGSSGLIPFGFPEQESSETAEFRSRCRIFSGSVDPSGQYSNYAGPRKDPRNGKTRK